MATPIYLSVFLDTLTTRGELPASTTAGGGETQIFAPEATVLLTVPLYPPPPEVVQLSNAVNAHLLECLISLIMVCSFLKDQFLMLTRHFKYWDQ